VECQRISVMLVSCQLMNVLYVSDYSHPHTGATLPFAN
jgi:hypothetical protein